MYGEYDGTESNVNVYPYMLIREDNVLVTYKGDKLNIDSVDVVTDHISAGNEIEIGDREFSVVRVADIMAEL